MQKTFFLLLFVLLFSCAEKLMDKPENLIAKDKMILIFNDLAILNAAKSTNMAILRKHEIEPTSYIFEKYDIDSLQFVESDRYYASIPEEHESIYRAVEAKLTIEKDRQAEIKKVKDSLETLEKEIARTKQMTKDSLRKIENMKK
jgi:hypothetical protein